MRLDKLCLYDYYQYFTQRCEGIREFFRLNTHHWNESTIINNYTLQPVCIKLKRLIFYFNRKHVKDGITKLHYQTVAYGITVLLFTTMDTINWLFELLEITVKKSSFSSEAVELGWYWKMQNIFLFACVWSTQNRKFEGFYIPYPV